MSLELRLAKVVVNTISHERESSKCRLKPSSQKMYNTPCITCEAESVIRQESKTLLQDYQNLIQFRRDAL